MELQIRVHAQKKYEAAAVRVLFGWWLQMVLASHKRLHVPAVLHCVRMAVLM